MTLSSSAQPSWILPLSSEHAALALVGGKGANLARLARAGFPVPAGFLITTDAYRAFVSANGLTEPILDLLATGAPKTPDDFEEVSRQIRARFSQGRLPAGLADAILAAYAALADPQSVIETPRCPIAVRSSATAEDLPEMSFAGQQDTFLNVVGGDSLLSAVIACWSSLWTGRAISYRERNHVAHTDVSLAVVVQEMVESQAAGVLFTANPLSGLRSETVINATVGLGEALVAGQVDPDQYVVDMRTGQIAGRALGAKAVSVRSRPGGGTVTVVEERRGEVTSPLRQALPDEQIQALAALGQRVADLYGTPQDIEWAWGEPAQDTDGPLARSTAAAAQSPRLHLLQTRPITSLFPVPAELAADPLKVLLSFGALQGMLEPMTPLGRALLYQVIAAGARLFNMKVTGETQTAVFTAGERLWVNVTPLLRNTVGRRIMPVVTEFVDPAGKETLEAIGDDLRLQPTRRGISPQARRQIAHAVIPLAGNVLLNVLTPARRRRAIVARGERLLDVMAERCAAIQGDPHARLAELARLMPEFIGQHLPRAFRLFVSGVASGMATFNLLRVLTRDLPGIPSDRHLEATRGLPNNPTTEMDLALWQVSQAIRRDAASWDAFRSRPAAELADAYRAAVLPPVAQDTLGQFMARYGSRGLAEIDMGRPRWSEDATHVMEVVAGYLQITDPAQAPDTVFARGAAAANAVIEELAAAVRRRRRGWLKARLVRFAAGRMRALMGMRESPKFFAVRLFGLVRAELLEVGQELAEAGELRQADDLCYLSFAELAAFAGAGDHRGGVEQGQRTREDWIDIIAQRRDAYRREELRRQIPRLLLSDGRAFYAGLTAQGDAAGALAGSPVSPGSVTGQVRVVRDPRRAGLLPGEILVCPGTDPSWTPLFLTAAGLVMEVGGMMTHGAVVAREYGIPAVVGVDRATERLQTGQTISLNGSTGEIRILKPA